MYLKHYIHRGLFYMCWYIPNVNMVGSTLEGSTEVDLNGKWTNSQ